jgi:hypothetical protein
VGLANIMLARNMQLQRVKPTRRFLRYLASSAKYCVLSHFFAHTDVKILADVIKWTKGHSLAPNAQYVFQPIFVEVQA